jgi:hypothetical protein
LEEKMISRSKIPHERWEQAYNLGIVAIGNESKPEVKVCPDISLEVVGLVDG